VDSTESISRQLAFPRFENINDFETLVLALTYLLEYIYSIQKFANLEVEILRNKSELKKLSDAINLISLTIDQYKQIISLFASNNLFSQVLVGATNRIPLGIIQRTELRDVYSRDGKLTIPEWNSVVWAEYCLMQRPSKMNFVQAYEFEKEFSEQEIRSAFSKAIGSLQSQTITDGLQRLITSVSTKKVLRGSFVDHSEDLFVFEEIDEQDNFNPLSVLDNLRKGDYSADGKIRIIKHKNQIYFVFPHALIDGQPARMLVEEFFKYLIPPEAYTVLDTLNIEKSGSETSQTELFNSKDRSVFDVALQTKFNGDNPELQKKAPFDNVIVARIMEVLEEILPNDLATSQVSQMHLKGGRLDPIIAHPDTALNNIIKMLAQNGIPIGQTVFLALAMNLPLQGLVNNQPVQNLLLFILSKSKADKVPDFAPRSTPTIVVANQGQKDFKSLPGVNTLFTARLLDQIRRNCLWVM